MNYSSLVLIERDDNGMFLNELGSYEVRYAAEYIYKFYKIDDAVTIEFNVGRDVEEWEFTAIYDLFDKSEFEKEGFEVEDMDDEYNPTWSVTMDYSDEHSEMVEKLNDILEIIEESVVKVLDNIKDKKEQYSE